MKNWLEYYQLSDSIREIKRDTIRLLWEHELTITCRENVLNKETGIEEPVEKIICENEPCRLCKQQTNPTDKSPSTMNELVHCMFKPEIEVPAGSIFKISFNGKTETYSLSSPPQVYWDHQTVKLRIIKPDKGGMFA